MEKADLIDLMVEWAKAQPGLRANTFIPEDEIQYKNAKIAQFYTGEGYNNYKKTGIWLACACIDDPEGLRLWGPDSFGEAGGTPRGPDGQKISGRGIWWLKPGDPSFFEKLHKVLFRFHRRKP